jgi:hypothetical protein
MFPSKSWIGQTLICARAAAGAIPVNAPARSRAVKPKENWHVFIFILQTVG